MSRIITSQQAISRATLHRSFDPGMILLHLYRKAEADIPMSIPDNAMVTIRVEYVVANGEDEDE